MVEMVNEAKDVNSDQQAIAAVEHHHAQMLTRLNHLTLALIDAVDSGKKPAEHDAHALLVEWCEIELIPHALAEESAIYERARSRPEAKLLVEGLLAEHRVITNTLEELRGAQGIRAAALATAIERLFAQHLNKENTLLLPFIVSQPDLSLVESVEGLHEIIGEAHPHGGEHLHTTTETRLA